MCGIIGYIGTHAHNLAGFVTGLEPSQILADLTTFVPGRKLDDNVQIMLRYKNGARGSLWASQVAPGNENGLMLRVYGTEGGIHWRQDHPNELYYTPYGEPTRTLQRGGPGSSQEARRGSRMPAGHPEGYVEGFANLYRDAAELIAARRAGRPPSAVALASTPSVIDGARGVAFIEAAVASSRNDGAWTSARLI